MAAIVVLAAALRFSALGYGLPGVYNPDEIPILNRALAFAKGDLNPHNFLYPSLYFYMLFAWQGLYFVVGYVLGLFASLDEFQRGYFQDPSRLILAGRALTATCGVVTVVAAYRFGAALYGRAAGMGAALFMAVAPFAVRDAHYVKLDVPVAMFATLTLAVLARIVVDQEPASRRRSWLLAGAFAGLTMSTHYYAIFIVVPVIVAAIVYASRSGRWLPAFQLLVWAGVASVAGFLAGTPFIITEPAIAIRDMVAVREIDIDRAVAGSSAFTSLGSYLHMLATDALGWPVFAASVAGLVAALAHDWRRGVLLVSFPLAFLAFVANTVPMSRYLNVMLPPLAVAAAFALTRIAGLLADRGASRRPGLRAALTAAAVLGAAVPGFANSVRSDRFFAAADTRALALAWVEREIPAGTSILTQPYSVPLQPSRDSLVEALRANLGSETRASMKFQMQLDRTPYAGPTYRLIYLGQAGGDPPPNIIYISPRAFETSGGLAPLRAMRITHVIVKRTNAPNPSLSALDQALAREAQRIKIFSPYRAGVTPSEQATTAPYFHNTAARIAPELERPGPVIEIWRLN